MAEGDRWALVELPDGRTQPTKLNQLLQIGNVTIGPTPSLAIRFESETHRYLDITFPDVDAGVASALGMAADALNALEQVSEMLANDQDTLGGLMEAIGLKADKVDGKGLSTNDLTNELLAKLNSALQDPAAFDQAGAADVAKGYAVQRGHHTGTQTASTISDFSTAVTAITAPLYATLSQGAKADTALQPSDMATEVAARQAAGAALAASINSKAPSSRIIATTAPLQGGGDMSADRTLSIPAATTSAAGSMSAADKTKLDGIASGATALSLSSTSPANLGSVAAVGVGTTAARADHVHKGPVVATGSASTSAVLLAGSSLDLTINLSATMPDTSYGVHPTLTNSSLSVLGTLSVVPKTKNLTNVVVTLKNTGLATIAIGQVVEVLAVSPNS